HNPTPHEAVPGFRLAEQALLRRADAVVVHCDRGAREIARRLGSDDRVHVIPHGIAVADQPRPAAAAALAPLGLPEGRRFVCMFGNLRGYKGVEVLLEAWRRVKDDAPDVDLVVAGRMWGTTRTSWL